MINWSDPGTYYVDWEADSVLQYWGGKNKFEEFLNRYSHHKHILSFEDIYYFSAGKSNRYGGFSTFPVPTWGNIYSFEPEEQYDTSGVAF